MKLHLVDVFNNRDKIYETEETKTYYGIFKEIDKIVDEHNYSCIYYPIPKIDKENKTITIHWIELGGDLSVPYIEILECADNVLKEFDYKIKSCLELKRIKNA